MAVILGVVNPDSDELDARWRKYARTRIARKGGFDSLMNDLQAVADKTKEVVYTSEGIPAFLVKE